MIDMTHRSAPVGPDLGRGRSGIQRPFGDEQARAPHNPEDQLPSIRVVHLYQRNPGCPAHASHQRAIDPRKQTEQ